MSSLKLVLTAAAAVLAMGTSALAADLVMEPGTVDDVMTEDWTGLYVGAQLAGVAFDGPIDSYHIQPGIVVGANVQFDQVVIGVEGRLAYFIDNLFPDGFVGGISGRAGYLVTPETLAYASTGYEHFLLAGGTTYWTAGLGVEFKVTENLSLDLEAKRWIEVAGPYVGNAVSASVNWNF